MKIGKDKQCTACGQLLFKSRDCDAKLVEIDRVRYRRINYGSSTEGYGPALSKCMGCGVSPGKTHHWLCAFEVCPKCNRQLISCSCDAKVKSWEE